MYRNRNELIESLKDTRKKSEIYDEIEIAIKRQYDKKKILSVKNEKLNYMLKHAYNNTEFYKRKYRYYVDNNNGECSSDIFEKLPLLEKQDIKDNFLEMISKDYELKKCMRNRTSGSTGKPVVNIQDVYEHNKAFKVNFMRERQAWGVEGLNNILMVVPKHFAINNNEFPNYVIDDLSFDKVWQIHPQEKEYDFEEVFKIVKPDIIYGNPHLLLSLAEKLEDTINEFGSPKIIISSFEMLDNAAREYLKQVFRCKIYDVYGFSEVGDIAWQCPTGDGYHINDDYVIVEVLNENNEVVYDEIGDIVVTSLYNYPMPIIRYKVGDKGIFTKEECPCGRKTYKLKNIIGRNVDFILLPSGKKISPYDVMNVMNMKNIRQFQIVQESKEALIIKYVSGLSEYIRNCLKNRISKLLKNEIEIQFVEVNNIPLTKSGKFKIIESKIN